VLAGADGGLEQCEICALDIPTDHAHLIDIESQRLLCVCRACVILFDNKTAGPQRYARVPDRMQHILDCDLDDALWERLGIPVDIMFAFRSTAAGRVVAFYPSPAGATESMLQLSAWSEMEQRNPVLTGMQADVEAFLVNRARGARNYMIVPVDSCYRLVGIIRTRWRGLSGGDEVWRAISGFFDELQRRADAVGRDGDGNAIGSGTTTQPYGTRNFSSLTYQGENHV
jgi:hypothetical protein